MLGLSVIILFKSLLHVFCSLVFSAHNSSGIPKECFDKFTHKYMQICAQGVATFPILTSLECRNKTIKRHIVRLQTHARKFKLHNFLELIQTFRLSKSYLYDVQTYGRIVFKSDIKIFVFI